KQKLVSFHAAIAHADMCSEHVAIACSMFLYYFFQNHPKLGWDETTTISSLA
ncbi:hypothetical protein PHYSODRAFT_525465, partial [Phytophthora sojae]